MLATLTEELGEVSRVVNHMYGDKKKKDGESLKALEEELGDLLFSLICMANDQGISLSDAHSKKMKKVYQRDNNRFQRK